MAKKTLARVSVDLDANTVKFQQGLDKAGKKAQSWRKQTERQISGVAQAFKGFIAGYAGLRGFQAIIDSTAKTQAAMKQLEATIKSTGGVIGLNAKQLSSMADEYQKLSTFDSSEIVNGMALLGTFTNITGQAFVDTTKAALDMSAKMGQSLKTSVIQLGKALNDPIKGVSALAEVGVSFTAQQKEQIKTLVESNQLYKAQGVILAELNKEFGGSAAAAADTLGGAMTQLRNAFSDLLATDDGMPAVVDNVRELTQVLQDPKTKQAADLLISTLVAGFSKLVEGSAGALQMISRLFGAVFSSEDEIPALQNRLDDLNAQMASLVETQRIGGVVAGDRVALLQEEINKTERLLRIQTELRNDRWTAARSAPEPAAGVMLSPGTAGDFQGSKKATDKVALHKKAYSANLAEANAILDAAVAKTKERMEQAEKDVEAMLEREADAMASVAQIKYDLLDDEGKALEDLKAKYLELQEAVRAGVITQEEAAAISGALAEKFEEGTDTMSEFAIQAARNMQSAFANFLFDPFQGGLRGMLTGFIDTIRRMSAELIASQIFDWLGSKDGGSGILGKLGGFFAGAKDAGGPIPAGQFALVGERGPELVAGPAMVTSRIDTARAFDAGGGGSAGAGGNVRVVNAIDPRLITEHLGSAAGEQIILNIISRNGRKVRQAVGG